MYIDVGGNNDHTPLVIVQFLQDLSGDSIQIFMEVLLGISKFRCPYECSYIFNSPYMISSFKRVKNVKRVPMLKIMNHDIDKRTSVDINQHKILKYPRVFDEFDQWFAGQITVDCTIQQLHKIFQILLSYTSLG